MNHEILHRHIFSSGESQDALTLVLLHGTGGDEYSFLEIAKELHGQPNILSIRGNVMEGNYRRFFKRFADGTFDQEDLHMRTKELAQFVLSAKKEYCLEKSALVALGYSNGANMAASMLLSPQRVFDGAILLRGMLPFEPATPVSNPSVPILMISGLHDQLMPQARVEELETALCATGASVDHVWLEAGHELVTEDFLHIRNWLSRQF